MKDDNYTDSWIGVRKSFGQTREVIAYTGATLQTGLYLSNYFEAYSYIRAYASSWQSLSFKVLKEDGMEWEFPKSPS